MNHHRYLFITHADDPVGRDATDYLKIVTTRCYRLPQDATDYLKIVTTTKVTGVDLTVRHHQPIESSSSVIHNSTY